MEFIKTEVLQINIEKKQEKQLSSKNKIEKMLKEKDVLGFNIFENGELIGFAMLKQFDKNKYFLWDYLIEFNHQNKGLGTKALKELINLLKTQYFCDVVTTTYKYGNLPAKHLYEKVGFIETDVVNEDDVYEINMILHL